MTAIGTVRLFRATSLPDGAGYMALEMPGGAPEPEIASYHAASGQPIPFTATPAEDAASRSRDRN